MTVTKLHIFSRKSVSEGEGVGFNKLLLNEKGGPDGTAFFGGIVMICVPDHSQRRRQGNMTRG